MQIDLHIHTNYSDGTFTPGQAVEYASKIGIRAISIVDHDTTNGIEEAIQTGQRLSVEVVPGIELSAEELVPQGQEIHIIGYYIDWKSEPFQKKLLKIREARWLRAEKMLKKLSNLGIELKMDDLLQFSNIQSVGRLHVAKALMNKSHIQNIKEAFDKYLSPGRPVYEPKLRITPKEAIQDILELGGIPVIAHPMYGIDKDETIVKELVSYGLMGIEVWHPKHSKNIRAYYKDIAKKYKLIATGGSDCHGPTDSRGPLMGSESVPYKCIEDLKNALSKK